MKSNTKSFILIVVVIAVIVGGLIYANSRSKNSTENSGDQASSDSGDVSGVSTTDNSLNPDNKDSNYIANLAKFMASKGMTMYGASWCSHCQAQKKAFGTAVSEIKYVECSSNTSEAQSAECSSVTYIDASTGKSTTGIAGYPTWVYNGKGYSGQQTLPQLAEIVGYVEGSSN